MTNSPEMRALDPLAPDPAFDAWVNTLDPKHWAKYDLSACLLGWNAARASHAQGEVAGLLLDIQAWLDELAAPRVETQRLAIRAAIRALSLPHSDGAVAEEAESCFACAEPFMDGDLVLYDVSGALIHAACCGPERESYVRDVDTGEPLRSDDPIPKGWPWHRPKATSELSREVLSAVADFAKAKGWDVTARCIQKLANDFFADSIASPINPVPAGVGVKELEWRQPTGPWSLIAEALGLVYRVTEALGGEKSWQVRLWNDLLTTAPSKAEAKAAAQADFNAKFRALILRQAPDAEQGADRASLKQGEPM